MWERIVDQRDVQLAHVVELWHHQQRHWRERGDGWSERIVEHRRREHDGHDQHDDERLVDHVQQR